VKRLSCLVRPLDERYRARTGHTTTAHETKANSRRRRNEERRRGYTRKVKLRVYIPGGLLTRLERERASVVLTAVAAEALRHYGISYIRI
jgi:hypothetical protein